MDEDEIKRLEDFDGWVKEKVEMRKFLIAQIEKREFDKNTRNDRRSAASQNRMQLLNQAADTRADDSEFVYFLFDFILHTLLIFQIGRLGCVQ